MIRAIGLAMLVFVRLTLNIVQESLAKDNKQTAKTNTRSNQQPNPYKQTKSHNGKQDTPPTKAEPHIHPNTTPSEPVASGNIQPADEYREHKRHATRRRRDWAVLTQNRIRFINSCARGRGDYVLLVEWLVPRLMSAGLSATFDVAGDGWRDGR